MHLSLLRLDDYFFTEIRLTCQPEAVGQESNPLDLVVETEAMVDSTDRPRCWIVFLTIKLNSKQNPQYPFVGTFSLIGRFTVDESWKEDRVEELVYVNGSGLLYASAREMIILLTGRTIFASLQLPSWSFGQMWTEHKRKRDEVKEKQPQLDLPVPMQAITETEKKPDPS